MNELGFEEGHFLVFWAESGKGLGGNKISIGIRPPPCLQPKAAPIMAQAITISPHAKIAINYFMAILSH